MSGTKRCLQVEEGQLRPSTVILAGFARLPESIAARHHCGFLSIEIELDPHDNRIVDCNCTAVSNLVVKIMGNTLLGSPIESGIRMCMEQLETRLYSVTKRALIAALEDVYRNFQKYRADQNNGDAGST
ncbi:MAG TPA: DUF3870 domain-containing protein [bacterium]|nr:DUF3870 domain-containing protein [bacterium]